MKVWKDKEGKELTAKEFGKRWVEGIKSVTPIQQTRSQIFFTWIMVMGMFFGFIISLYKWKTLWWVAIILLAGIGNTLITLLATYQKFRALKNIESIIYKEGKNDEQESTGL